MSRSQLRLRTREDVDSAGDGLAAIRFPTISGTLVAGQTLTAVHAQFAGTKPITVTGQWFRNGTAIEGETALTIEDVVAGTHVFRSTATNGKFPAVTASSLPAVVAAE